MLPGAAVVQTTAILVRVGTIQTVSMYDVAVMVGSGAVLVLAVWVLVRRRSLRWDGRIQDVPDAPPRATPAEAPGMTLPYSSLDPSAPPKQLGKVPPGAGPKAE